MTGTRKGSGTLAFVALTVLAVVLAGCLAGDARFTVDAPAGFWLGLWHGIMSPAALVLGIFYDGIRMYESRNTGGWYDFGFWLGVTSFWGANHARMRRRYPTCGSIGGAST